MARRRLLRHGEAAVCPAGAETPGARPSQQRRPRARRRLQLATKRPSKPPP